MAMSVKQAIGLQATAILAQILPGDGIIYTVDDTLFIRERDKEIPRTMQRKPLGTFAIFGSDILDEQTPSPILDIEDLKEPIINEAGQPLRYALMARTDRLRLVEQKIEAGIPLRMGTAYRKTMKRELAQLGIPIISEYPDVVSGKVEKMLYEEERRLDAVFDQVQSLASASAMNLTVMYENFGPISLFRATKVRRFKT